MDSMSNGSSISEDDEEANLDWRMHPSKSLSDFTLEIVNDRTGDSSLYHVHRVVLAVGPRKCGYLRDLIRGRKNDASSASNGSRGSRSSRATREPKGGPKEVNSCTLTMNEYACHLIPQFLGYVYNSNEFQLTTGTAVGMSYLAQLFVQTSLQQEVKAFIRNDLSLLNLTKYYEDSIYFDQQETSTLVARLCAKEILHIDPSSPILWKFTPHFFLIIVSSAAPHVSTTADPEASQAHLSQLVASFCITNRDRLDGVMFEMLTSRDRLPIIEFNAAIKLLEIEADIRRKSKHQFTTTPSLSPSTIDCNGNTSNGVVCKGTVGGTKNSSAGKDCAPANQLTCLQTRCVRVIVRNWRNLTAITVEGQTIGKVLNKLPSFVTSRIFQEFLTRSSGALSEMQQTIDQTKRSEAQIMQDRDAAYEKLDSAVMREKRLKDSLDKGKRRERHMEGALRESEDRERMLVEKLDSNQVKYRRVKELLEASRVQEVQLRETLETSRNTLKAEIAEQRMVNERMQEAFQTEKKGWADQRRVWEEDKWNWETERREWETVRTKWERDFVLVQQEIRKLHMQQQPKQQQTQYRHDHSQSHSHGHSHSQSNSHSQQHQQQRQQAEQVRDAQSTSERQPPPGYHRQHRISGNEDDVELNPLSVSSLATSYASRYFEGSVFSRSVTVEKGDSKSPTSVIMDYSHASSSWRK